MAELTIAEPKKCVNPEYRGFSVRYYDSPLECCTWIIGVKYGHEPPLGIVVCPVGAHVLEDGSGVGRVVFACCTLETLASEVARQTANLEPGFFLRELDPRDPSRNLWGEILALYDRRGDNAVTA